MVQLITVVGLRVCRTNGCRWGPLGTCFRHRRQPATLQNCNICKQDSEDCPVNLSNRSFLYVFKSSAKDDLNPQ